MRLNGIDSAIILLYLGITIVIGLVLKKRARADEAAYLLGGNRLPWYMLGISNASGMFDISGTMWLVSLTFVYGLKSIWIPWLWPIFNQIFLMVFLSAWLRRSRVMTGAEWIGTRFGTGRGSALSHDIVVVFALVSCLGFLAYGFIGLGKFMEIFIPWETVSRFVPFHVPTAYVPHLYGLVFTAFSVFYTILGGMVSIVWADVIQYVIMGLSAVLIGVTAMRALAVQKLAVPAGWMSPFFGLHLNLDWGGLIAGVNEKIAADGYSLFAVFFMMMLFKGLLVSAAGPAPNYDMQKILATRSPREASLMSGFVSVVLNPVRYLMITGFAVLGILYYKRLDLIVGGRLDFEQILPSAIHEFVPAGLTGLILAGLLAAFIGTFAGTLNAAQAYIINDIYLKYIKPKAGRRQVASVTYLSGGLVVAVSILISLFALDINSILQWIVSALWGSYIVSNVLKWYWWRFNGHGYFWGMISGLIPALIFPALFHTLDLTYFPLILLISAAGAVIGTYRHPPTEEKVLKEFYRTVRPWGFWRPVHALVAAEDPGFRNRSSWKRDAVNVAVGIVWQLSMIALPIYFVLRKFAAAGVCLLITAATSAALKLNWYDKMERD
jgi:solute:Na+ symporter, SSS family